MPRKDPTARAEWQREYMKTYQRPPRGQEEQRRDNLRKLYGITPEEYDSMFERQGGLCALCGRPERRRYKDRLLRLSVDHNHQTASIRGLLCHACNTGLGAFEDSTALLSLAIEYLDAS